MRFIAPKLRNMRKKILLQMVWRKSVWSRTENIFFQNLIQPFWEETL